MSIGPSPSMRYCLLRPNGELTDGLGNAVRRPGAGKLLLSRALLRFARVAPPINLPKAVRKKAALTFADSNAPFERSASFILQSGDGFSVWWWDRIQVKALMAPYGGASWRQLYPETIFVGHEAAWRHLALADGYEAQAWRDGALLASSWRPTPFGKEAWSSFLLTVDDAAAPVDPPAPTSPVMCEPQGLREQTVRASVGAPEATTTMLLLSAAGVLSASYYAGQAMRAAYDLDRNRAISMASSPAATPVNEEKARAYIGAYEELTQSSDVAVIAAMVLESARKENLTVQRYSFDGGQIRVRLSSTENSSALAAFLRDLEASDTIAEVGVRSASDGEQIEISARMLKRPGGA